MYKKKKVRNDVKMLIKKKDFCNSLLFRLGFPKPELFFWFSTVYENLQLKILGLQ